MVELWLSRWDFRGTTPRSAFPWENKNNPEVHQSGPEIDENNSEVDQSWPEIDKNNSEVDRSGPETDKHNSEMHKNASANAITPWQKLRVLLPLNHITGLLS